MNGHYLFANIIWGNYILKPVAAHIDNINVTCNLYSPRDALLDVESHDWKVLILNYKIFYKKCLNAITIFYYLNQRVSKLFLF